MSDSEEAKVLACRKALEFAVDAGFVELLVEGDNTSVMRNISNWFTPRKFVWGYSLFMLRPTGCICWVGKSYNQWCGSLFG